MTAETRPDERVERQSQDKQAEKIERLERELAEVRAALRDVGARQFDAMDKPDGNAADFLSQLQQELTESENRYNRLINRMPAIIFELDSEGRIIYANDALAQMAGRQVHEVEGMNFWQMFLPGDSRTRGEELRRLLGRQDVAQYELRLQDVSGTKPTFEISTANHYSESGELERVAAIGLDITRRQLAERDMYAYMQELRIADEEMRHQNEELIRAQQRLVEERQRYLDLFEFAPDGYLVTDANGTILEANQAAAALVEERSERVIGRNLPAFVKNEQRGHFYTMLGQLKKRKSPIGWETTLVSQDKRERPVSLIAGPVFGKNQTITRLRWLVHDIAPRKRAENELLLKSEQLHLLSDITAAANSTANLEDALHFALKRVCEHTRYVLGHVFFAVDEDPPVLESSSLWALSEVGDFEAFQAASQSFLIPLGAGLPGKALEQREPVWVQDVTIDESFIRREAAEAVGLRSAFAFPVLAGNDVAAVLEFYSNRDDPQDAALMDVIRQVGVQLGRVAERSRAEQALRKSEARFRAIFDEAAVGILILNLDGQIVDSNPAMQTLLGSSDQDLRGRSIYEVIEAEDRLLARALLEPLLSGEQAFFRTEQRFAPRGDQPARWGRLAASLVRDVNDAPVFAILMVEDITDRKQMAAELEEVQRRLMDSAEAERLLLAQELHDGPVQNLLAIIYQLEGVRNSLAPQPREKLEAIRIGIQMVMSELRSMTGELRPPTLAPFGLEKAIRSHIDHFRQRNPGIPVFLELDTDGQALSERVRLALFRVYQHGVANILQHAEADEIRVRLQLRDEYVLLEVEDNGRGFELPERWVDLARQGHLGLVGARERVEAIGGTFDVKTAPGAGTLLRVRAPLKA